jgi:hypothetical protein
LDFCLSVFAGTKLFKLGAAAITFTTAFFGFFSSRRRLVMPLAMILPSQETAFWQPSKYRGLLQEGHSHLLEFKAELHAVASKLKNNLV